MDDKGEKTNSSEIKKSVKVKELLDSYLQDHSSLDGMDLEFPDASLDLEGVDVVTDPDSEEETSSLVTIEYKKSYEKEPPVRDNQRQSSSEDRIKKAQRLAHQDATHQLSKKERFIQTATFIVFDIETSGGNPQKNGITEIFAIKYRNGDILGTFHSLVNPRCRIPPIVRRMTGLDNKILHDAPYIEEVMPEFVRFIEDYPMVSHNIVGDMKYLDYFALKTIHKELVNKTLCTQLLSEKLFSNLPSKSLEGLMNYFNLTRHEMHRAEGDAYVTLDLFKLLVSKLKERNILLVDDALRLQGDLASCMRLGWKITKRACDFPDTTGILYFYGSGGEKDLLYIVSTTNLRDEFQKLSDFTQLPKQLIKTLVYAQEVKYEVCSDFYTALLKEGEQCKRITSSQTLLFIKHQRGIPALLIVQKKDKYFISVDSPSLGTKSVFCPVSNRVLLVEQLEKLAAIYGVEYSKKIGIDKECVDEIYSVFSGNIEDRISKLEKSRSSVLRRLLGSKNIDTKLNRCKQLLEFKGAFPSCDYLNESGLVIILTRKGYRLYPLVRLRSFLNEERYLSLSQIDSMDESEFKTECIKKIKKIDKKIPDRVLKEEIYMVNFSLYWLISGGKKDGFYVSMKDLEDPSFQLFKQMHDRTESYFERLKSLSNKDRKNRSKLKRTKEKDRNNRGFRSRPVDKNQNQDINQNQDQNQDQNHDES